MSAASDRRGQRTESRDKAIEMSDEEKRAFAECNSESFWYRCVPFGIGLSALVQYGTVKGFVKPHPKYGSLFKILGASLAGYIIGKASYWQECRKKLMALPNSKIGEQMRHRRTIRETVLEQQNTAGQQPDDYHMTSTGTQGDVDDRGRDYDTHVSNQNDPSGMDDSLRPSMDANETSTLMSQSDEAVKPRTVTTYDDLRKRNRDERSQYQPEESERREFGRRPWTQPQPVGDGRIPAPRTPSPPPQTNQKTNKYGDEMD